MLTTRTLLLTSAGLLTGFMAAGQTTPPAGPQPTDVLSWVTWAAAGVVLLMAVITAASGASAGQRYYIQTTGTATNTEAVAPAEPTASTDAAVPVATELPTLPLVQPALTEESVAA